MKLIAWTCLFLIQLSVMGFAGQRPCPFCNEAVYTKDQVFENEYFRVMIDYAPIVKGHLLITPKRHIMKAHQMTQEEWNLLGTTIPRVVDVFQKVFHADQYIILEKNGPLAGQTVPHVHFHLVPITSPESALQAKAALFAKFYDTAPVKLTEAEKKELVELLRTSFAKQALELANG